MAIISSYPISIPQLADKIIGTNATDAYGNPVVNNPTSQYTFSSVKTLIDQHYIQKISTSNESPIVPGVDDTGIPIIFGATDITTLDVTYIASTGTITFKTLGSYCIQQLYYAQATSGNNIQLNFKTLQGGATQVGPTTATSFLSNTSTARHRIDITSYVDIDIEGTYYNFWVQNPSTGAPGSLQPQTIPGAWGTDVPSAQLIITKLV
jgi:hypothetical protein|tara:strand:- start:341 stop:964 length:624 start_codon:yes stop_codon:yes gene_type:complete